MNTTTTKDLNSKVSGLYASFADRLNLHDVDGLLELLLAMGCTQIATAQPAKYTTADKGAIKRYESGNSCMGLRKWDCAESEFTKAADADPRFIEPRIMLAEIA